MLWALNTKAFQAPRRRQAPCHLLSSSDTQASHAQAPLPRGGWARRRLQTQPIDPRMAPASSQPGASLSARISAADATNAACTNKVRIKQRRYAPACEHNIALAGWHRAILHARGATALYPSIGSFPRKTLPAVRPKMARSFERGVCSVITFPLRALTPAMLPQHSWRGERWATTSLTCCLLKQTLSDVTLALTQLPTALSGAIIRALPATVGAAVKPDMAALLA